MSTLLPLASGGSFTGFNGFATDSSPYSGWLASRFAAVSSTLLLDASSTLSSGPKGGVTHRLVAADKTGAAGDQPGFQQKNHFPLRCSLQSGLYTAGQLQTAVGVRQEAIDSFVFLAS